MGTVKLPDSITGYIDRLNEVQRERLMTTRLIPSVTHAMDGGQPAGCLVGVAMGGAEMVDGKLYGDVRGLDAYAGWDWGMHVGEGHCMVDQFNNLARMDRGGTEQAIRDYIVELRLKQGGTVPEPAMATVHS